MARVVLDGVGKRYPDGHEAVVDLDLEVADGEFLVLVGPSGCGKTSTLRMIAGLEQVTSGRVLIDDADVTALRPGARDVSMVFQSFALYPHMTVAENLGFALKLAKLEGDVIRARVGAVAEVLDLTEHLDRKPSALSGGQQQRVAMGRAMVREPQVFLMDEPLSNLDAKLRVQMRGEVAALQHRLGTTTIYVTHDQVEAMTMGDRVAVLSEGRLQQVAAPQELYERPANLFVAGFMGSPAINLIASSQAGSEVVLGVRPEHLSLVSVGDGAEFTAGGAWATGEVTLVELLGPEVLIHVHASPAAGPSCEVVVRRPSGDHPGVGERVALSFDARRALSFDPVSGQAL